MRRGPPLRLAAVGHSNETYGGVASAAEAAGQPPLPPTTNPATPAAGVGCRSVQVCAVSAVVLRSVCSVACALTGRGFSTPFVFWVDCVQCLGKRMLQYGEQGCYCSWQRPRSDRALQAASSGVRFCCSRSGRGAVVSYMIHDGMCGDMYVHARRRRSAAQCGCGDQHQGGQGQGRVCRCSGAGGGCAQPRGGGLVAHHVPTCWFGPLPPTRQALYRRYSHWGGANTQVNSIPYLARHAAGAAVQQVPWGC
jgi:hypothetical protein